MLRGRFLGVVVCGLAACGVARAEPITGLVGNNLVQFNSQTPGLIHSSVGISGLPAGFSIAGIDYRPADGALIGVGRSGSNAMTFVINPFSGVATALAPTPSPFTLNGSRIGIDFNPVPGALRIVSTADQNLRITAGGGGIVNTDGTLNPGNPNVVAAAYSNNVPGGVGGQTTLYVIDSNTDSLYTQGTVNFPPGTSPNTGTLILVGGLGVDVDELTGFDISGESGVGFVSANGFLFTVNLNTGALTPIGALAPGQFADIAVTPTFLFPEPMTLALFGGLAVGAIGLARRRRA